jgi:hypothetical protein
LGIDFTYLHPEVLDERCVVEGGKLTMSNVVNYEQFSTLVLPGVKVISLSNIRKIEEAWKQGVKVVFTTQYPQQSADGSDGDEEVKGIVARMLGSAENRAIFVPLPSASSLAEVMEECLPSRDVRFSDGAHPFNYLHKVIDEHDVWYFGNIDATAATNVIRVKTSARKLTLLNPHTGKLSEPEILQIGNGYVDIRLSLRPCQSMFLVDDNFVIRNGAIDNPEGNKLSYSIELQAEVEQLSAGVCFAITDQQNYYMWQFNVSDKQHPCLRPHRWLGGNASLLGEIELPKDVNMQAGHPFNIRIEIEDESYAKTYIDNVLVDERGGNFAYGRIGFRQAHDDAYGKTEIALFDDVIIKVKTTSGSSGVVFEEDFSDSNPFSEGFVVSERLRVEGQMSRDILAWLYDVPDAISSIPASSAMSNKNYYTLDGKPAQRSYAPQIIVSGGKKFLSAVR